MFGLARQLFGGRPRAHRQETGGGRGGNEMGGSEPGGGERATVRLCTGLAAGTRVATARGWRGAETICVGDPVLTFDRGMQDVRGITRAVAWDDAAMAPRAQWPLSVPAGALGNAEPLIVPPDQLVMLESDTAEMLYGDPFTLVLAADLDGLRGIERVPPLGAAETVQLHFDHAEVVFVGDGALAFCGRADARTLETMVSDARDAGYRSLDVDEALFLVESLELEDAVLAGACPDQQQEQLYAAWA